MKKIFSTILLSMYRKQTLLNFLFHRNVRCKTFKGINRD